MMNKLYSMGMENLLNLFWKLKVSQGCIISRVTIDVLQCTEKVVSLERLIITRLSRLYNQWCHMRFVSIYLSIWGDDIFHILERIESSQPWRKHQSKHYYCHKVDARGWTHSRCTWLNANVKKCFNNIKGLSLTYSFSYFQIIWVHFHLVSCSIFPQTLPRLFTN